MTVQVQNMPDEIALAKLERDIRELSRREAAREVRSDRHAELEALRWQSRRYAEHALAEIRFGLQAPYRGGD